MRNKTNFKRGFTLVELLIVIAIISILAGVVFVNTGSSRDKAKLAKALTILKSVATVANMCVISGGTLNVPAGNSSNPNIAICNGGTDMFPDLNDVGFLYCGNSCWGAWQFGYTYRLSVYSDAYSGGRKIILCADNRDGSGWDTPAIPQFDFTGKVGCATRF